MRRDPTEFRARFNAYKNGKMPYDAGLPKFAEGTGGVENNITEEYAPIVSDTYQSTVNKLKQQTAAFNVDDYVYVAKKLHPEITKEQVMNVYNNTPYVASDSSRGSTLGLYRHGEDDGYGRGITIYPRRMRPDGPDFNLEDRIKSNIFHESHHLFRDTLFGGKYTDEESKYLRLAIPDAIDDNERAARIREARGNINIQTGATGKKLDDAIDKMSSKEAKFHYSRLNSSEANTSGWNPQIEDAFRWALKNIASTQIRPKQGLLQAKDGKLPKYGDGTDALLQLTKGGVSMIPGAGTLIDGWDFYNNPSLENLGYLALSGIGDAAIFTGIGAPFGFSLKAIKSAAKLNKTRRTLNAVMSANKAGNAIQLHNAKKAYNASKAATRALAAETGNLVDTAKSTYEAYTK